MTVTEAREEVCPSCGQTGHARHAPSLPGMRLPRWVFLCGGLILGALGGVVANQWGAEQPIGPNGGPPAMVATTVPSFDSLPPLDSIEPTSTTAVPPGSTTIAPASTVPVITTPTTTDPVIGPPTTLPSAAPVGPPTTPAGANAAVTIPTTTTTTTTVAPSAATGSSTTRP